MNTKYENSITDMTDTEMLDFVSFAIQEAMNGNLGELDSALWIVETLREESSL